METNFSKHITAFLTVYLVNERGRSTNTIESYATSFLHLMRFLEQKQFNIKNLKVTDVTRDLVTEFLDWIENVRKCSAATRNVRLAAIKMFFEYLSKKDIRYISKFQEINGISTKSVPVDIPLYLKLDELKSVFKQPNLKTRSGLRDLALLILLYDSGARVQELINLTPASLSIKKNVAIKFLNSKGNKSRVVLLLNSSFEYVKTYMKEFGLNDPSKAHDPLFFNKQGNKLTRNGVACILRKYVELARLENSSIPAGISPHSLRHSKAMHLLAAGVTLIYIKHFLGHSSITTTEIYARVSLEEMEKALQKAPILSSQLSAFTPPSPEADIFGLLKSFSIKPRQFPR